MMLKPYTVLDFTDTRGEIGPMLMADLGADVIRVEPPAGNAARRSPPLLTGGEGLEESLTFRAFNRNKRSLVLDPDNPEDGNILAELMRRADFIFESWPDSPLATYGHNFDTARALNPKIVYTRLSAFGDSGPHADFSGADLVIAAMGGPVALQGDADRAPLRLSVPQVWRHAGVEAAAGAMVALHRMQCCGEAQYVDLSAQCCMTWTLLNAMDAHAIQGFDFQRSGGKFNAGATRFDIIHPTRDGHIIAIPGSNVLQQILPWLVAHGKADASLLQTDWDAYDLNWINPDHQPLNVFQAVDLCRAFFREHTKAELFAFGLQHDITLAPANTLAELLALEHMQERDYWDYESLAGQPTIRRPGIWAKTSLDAIRLASAAPELGQHSAAIRAELAQPPERPAPAAGPASPSTPSGVSVLPFSGITVADFSWVGVGPISAKYLADHGAHVIRIESDSRPDVLRGNGPFKDNEPGLDRSQFYGDFNTSKQSISLNLKSPAAIELARKIIARADIMIESFAPGAITRMGLSYDEVRTINPRLIMVSTCLMGQTGSAAQLAGYGYHAGAIAGFYDVIGWPDRDPNGPWVAYTDTIAPRFISILLAAALDHRRRTGEGCYMDVAQIETALHFLAPELMDLQLQGHAARRLGNRSRFFAPQGCYACAGDDNWCAIACETEAQWQHLAQLLEFDTAAVACASHAERLRAHDTIDAALSKWCATRSASEVMSTLQAAGVPAGMVQRSSDLLRDPQYAHRQFYRWLDHSVMGHIPYAGHQYRISGYDNGPRAPAPALGEHTFSLLSEFLELDDVAIAEAYASGAVT